MTRGLLSRQRTFGTLRPGVEGFLRRFLRISAQLYLLLAAVALVAVLDSSDTYADTETRTCVVRIGTYTWNWYLQDNPLEARPDLGHLWYLSVDMQAFVLILITVFLLRRRPVWLLTALFPALRGESCLDRTRGRHGDDLSRRCCARRCGWMRRWPGPSPQRLSRTSIGSRRTPAGSRRSRCSRSSPCSTRTRAPHTSLGWQGVALIVALAMFVVSCSVGAPGRAATVSMGWAPLVFLGGHSLSLYLWHYTTFWFVARHTEDWRRRPGPRLPWLSPRSRSQASGSPSLGCSDCSGRRGGTDSGTGVPSYTAGLVRTWWRRLRNRDKQSVSS